MRSAACLLFLAGVAGAAEKFAPFATGLREPFGIDFHDGQVLVTEHAGHRLIGIDPAGKVTVLAGSGKPGFKDGVGEEAQFNAPHNLAVAKDGTVYIADTLNHRVRMYDPKTKAVTTIAGGEKGYVGDGKAVDARFFQMYHVALDADQKNLYVCDLGNRMIRRIDLAAGTIERVVGSGKTVGIYDGGDAKEIALNDPRAVEVDDKGRIWIIERGGNRLVKVEDGKVRIVAGLAKGFAGDGGPAKKARLNGPKNLCIDPAGDVLIADTENHAIRKVTLGDGKIATLLGTGTKGLEAKGEVLLNRPHGVAVAPDGTIYVADSDNGRLLKAGK